MSFLWSWMSRKQSTQETWFVYQEMKKKVVDELVQAMKANQLQTCIEHTQDKDILQCAIKELNDKEKTETFLKQEQVWKDVFEFHHKDHMLIITLLCEFAEQVLHLNWKQEYSDFVSGRKIPYPFNQNMHHIKSLFEFNRYDALHKRFDFNHYWTRPIMFMSFLKEACNSKTEDCPSTHDLIRSKLAIRKERKSEVAKRR